MSISAGTRQRLQGLAAAMLGLAIYSIYTAVTRRGMLTASAALTGAAMAGVMSSAFAQKASLRPTSEQVMGPFYPVTLPADQDADLTVIAGKSGRALGQIVYVSGRVTNVRGEPVARLPQ